MYFEILKSGSGAQPYWWRASGNNHEVLCHSEMLSSKQACIDTVKVVKAGAAAGGVYDMTGETPGDVDDRKLSV